MGSSGPSPEPSSSESSLRKEFEVGWGWVLEGPIPRGLGRGLRIGLEGADQILDSKSKKDQAQEQKQVSHFGSSANKVKSAPRGLQKHPPTHNRHKCHYIKHPPTQTQWPRVERRFPSRLATSFTTPIVKKRLKNINSRGKQ